MMKEDCPTRSYDCWETPLCNYPFLHTDFLDYSFFFYIHRTVRRTCECSSFQLTHRCRRPRLWFLLDTYLLPITVRSSMPKALTVETLEKVRNIRFRFLPTESPLIPTTLGDLSSTLIFSVEQIDKLSPYVLFPNFCY